MAIQSSKLFKLYGEDGTVITIQEDGDGLGMVAVSTKGDYYGPLNFTMDADDAMILANAIIEQAKYIKEQNK